LTLTRWEHALLLMKDSSLRGFGSDTQTHGQLGGTDTDKAMPHRVGGMPSVSAWRL
jgi:hypothetical protein